MKPFYVSIAMLKVQKEDNLTLGLSFYAYQNSFAAVINMYVILTSGTNETNIHSEQFCLLTTT